MKQKVFTPDISGLQARMNEAGNKRSPFLFGVNYELTEGFFIENPLKQQEIRFQVKGIGNKQQTPVGNHPRATLQTLPVDYKAYQKGFDIVYDGLQRGDSFLANYTVKTPIRTSLSLEEIFDRSHSPYQLLVPGKFVCFSPERFVLIKEGKISTNPMKGTINASIPDAENIILNDFKESAEHSTIVDLMRNDLGITARNIRVEKYRYIDRITTGQREILQVSSEIAGELPSGYHAFLGDIIFSMLPAGSISGAPKASTLRIIKEAEQSERGYYTGIFGYFDGESLDTAVLIRFIEKENDSFFFRSGGGITANSQCEKEYREVNEKIYLPFL